MCNMKDKFKDLLYLFDEVYCLFVCRNHCTARTKELFKEYEAVADRLIVYDRNGYSESDIEDLNQIRSELERIEKQYWEDCKDGDEHWRS